LTDELEEAMNRLRNMIIDLKIWFATDVDDNNKAPSKN
jgi:hypothetical protein